MNQYPRPILSSIFSAVACVVLFDSAVYIISVPDIKFAVSAALEDIDVIHNYFFEILHV